MIRQENFIFKIPALCFALFLSVGACSYSLVGRGGTLPSDIQSVRIPIFKNHTREPDLEIIVTRVIREEFIKDGRLKVDDSPSADSTLLGEIQLYKLRPLAYDKDNNVTEYSVDLNVFITHTNDHTGKTLQRQKLETTWQYRADPSITVAESLRLDAIETASTQVAETIISLVIESF